MTFEEALAQIEVAVREHGATVEELVVRLRSGAISQERFVAGNGFAPQGVRKDRGETNVGGQEQRPCCNGIIEGARVSDKELTIAGVTYSTPGTVLSAV